MFGILANVGAVALGTAIGVVFRKKLSKTVVDNMWMAVGFVALGIGLQTTVDNLAKTNIPALFILSMGIGFPVGGVLKLEERTNKWMTTRFSAGLAQSIISALVLGCVGALAILGAITAATKGDNTMLITNAVAIGVAAIAFGAKEGWGMLLELPILFIFLFVIYIIAKTGSASFFSDAFIREICIVGGLIIIATGCNLLNIHHFKTMNMLPALLGPVIYFLFKLWF